PGSPFERTGSPAPSHLSARLAFGSWPAGHSVHALHHAAHGPVAAGPMHSPAHVSQHDAGDGLLLVVQRGVERLEGFRERLHALGTLGHTLADAVEPVGERWTLGRAALTPLLQALLELLTRLLPRGKPGAQLLLDGRPQLELGVVELEGLLHLGDTAFQPSLSEPLADLRREPRTLGPLAPLLRLRLRLRLRLGEHDGRRDGRRQQCRQYISG